LRFDASYLLWGALVERVAWRARSREAVSEFPVLPA